MSWEKAAACRDEKPEIFFPEQGGKAKRAKAICARCPVTSLCLQRAERFDSYGVFGGQLWNNGRIVQADEPDPHQPQPRTPGGQLSNRYPAETRAKAIAMYQEIRSQHRSDKAACVTIAKALGVRSPGSVQNWVRAELDPTLRQPGQRERDYAERRVRGLEMLHRVRGQHATEYGAYKAVAHALGVHTLTVRDWALDALEQKRAQLGKAA